jgi:hypothetical protein
MKISKAYLKKLIQEEVSHLGEDEGFERASDTTQDKAKTAILDNTPLGTQDTLDLIYELIQLIEDPDASERDGHQLVVDFFPGEE